MDKGIRPKLDLVNTSFERIIHSNVNFPFLFAFNFKTFMCVCIKILKLRISLISLLLFIHIHLVTNPLPSYNVYVCYFQKQSTPSPTVTPYLCRQRNMGSRTESMNSNLGANGQSGATTRNLDALECGWDYAAKIFCHIYTNI